MRQEIHLYLNSLDNKTICELSRQTSRNLISQKQWKEAGQILTFLSFGKEFETRFLIESALNEGKKVAVPRIRGREMTFHYLKSMDDKLETNRWGIREPLPDSEVWSPGEDMSLLTAPGLAFGPGGERLGRGGGFYDRFLSIHGRELTTVGLCFEEQIREEIPREEHDILLGGICTEKRFTLFPGCQSE